MITVSAGTAAAAAAAADHATTPLTANVKVLQVGQLEHRFRQDVKPIFGNVELSQIP